MASTLLPRTPCLPSWWRLTLCVLVCALWVGEGWAGQVQVQVTDSAARHIYTPGTPFQVTVAVSCTTGPCGTIRAQWRDARDNSLATSVVLGAGSSTSLTSPGSSVGAYDLRVWSSSSSDSLNDRPVGQDKRFGFAILPDPGPVSGRPWDPASRFGMVHADMDDPWLLPCWIKTMTWDSTSANWWAWELDERRARGHGEVPLVVGEPWASADTSAITSKLSALMQEDLDTLYWELGLEENLGGAFWNDPAYFSTLAAKAQASRQAANAAGMSAQFGYQIVGTSYDSAFSSFLQSGAAAHFQILAPHPYKWEAFDTPESWLEGFLEALRAGMDAEGHSGMKIWLSEVGAPINANPQGFFGYQTNAGPNPVEGITRARLPEYLLKVYVLALHTHVDKVFWYNYRDASADYEDPEANFGLVDYWGYPKPAYVAHAHMQATLASASPGASSKYGGPNGNVWAYAFERSGSQERVVVAWLYPAGTETVALSSVWSGLSSGQVLALTNQVGTPLSLSGESVVLTSAPVYITMSATDPCGSITCQNGGSCSQGVCQCPASYTGTYCETPVSSPSGSLSLYGDSLASGWSVSNARSVVSYTATPAWSGSYALSVQNTGGYGNLPFDYYTTLDTTGYTHLHLATRANVASATLDVTAFASWGNGDHTYVSLPCTTSWEEWFIPLSDMGVQDSDIVTVFFVENAAATNNIFYLDQVELVSLAPIVLYDDSLASSWSVSNARSVVSYTATPAWSGSYALSVQNTGGYGNLPFDYYTTLDTTGYTHLHLLARSNVASATLDVTAFASWGNGDHTYVSLPCTTSWKEWFIPLSDMDVQDSDIVTVFFVENAAATNNIFYLDQVELVSVRPVVAFDDQLRPGWTVDNVRSQVSYSATPAWEGSAAMSMQNTGGWGNLPLNSPTTLATGAYTHLHLAVRASTAATLEVTAFENWGNGDHTYYSISCSTSWQELYLPLALLGAEDTYVNTLFFTENQPATSTTFFLDRVEFVYLA